MRNFVVGHEDLVHDIAYDFYGKRIATCSSDQRIKVFERNKEADEWVLCGDFKAHDSAITKVVWAAPEFGSIIASCSYDGTVKIFEENICEPLSKRWKQQFAIADCKGALYDISFAPKQMKLASIGSDSVLRIHEPPDGNAVDDWICTFEKHFLSQPLSRHLQSSFALSWSPQANYIVACILDEAFILAKHKDGKYIRVAQLPQHDGLIRDVSWAPSLGRSYHLIATACKDGKMRIFKLQAPSPDAGERSDLPSGSISNNGENDDQLRVETLNSFDDHHGEVWKVSWNLTGTILASSGDDGNIIFWKAVSPTRGFQNMAIVHADPVE